LKIIVIYQSLTSAGRWAWLQVDKQGTGLVQKQDLLQLYKEFGNHVDTNLNVVKLIRMCDVNGNSVLDASEIREMLSVKNTSARPFT
jgi:Ca2+-binding EF-hand superfamily protein